MEKKAYDIYAPVKEEQEEMLAIIEKYVPKEDISLVNIDHYLPTIRVRCDLKTWAEILFHLDLTIQEIYM